LNGNDESTMSLWNYDGSFFFWVPVGKTGNSTSSNYVEQSGLTDINNRWTCGYAQSVAQWNGSVSSDWNTAANWTVLVGSASTPPSATDVAALGTGAFTNQPTISTIVNVKNIVFGSAQAVTLSIASGGSLTSGDILGIWSSNNTHTFNVNNQSVIINGGLLLSDGTSGRTINLNIGTGTVNVVGSLVQAGGANIVFTGAGNLNIANDYNYVSGTFTPGTGTVTYNGVVNQVIGPVNYNNLTINNAAASPSINNTTSISGNLTISAGELDNNSTTTIAGNVTIASGATLDNHGILQVGGNWANNGNYTSNGTGTNVIFDGSGTQTISSTTFNNLEFNKPVGSVAVLTGNVTLKGNLAGTSGTLDIGTYFFNRDIVGGSATMTNAATLIIAADNAPNKFAGYNLASGSTIIFNGTSTQHLLLPGLAYGNLVFRNSGSKILYTATTVNGDLTIESGATFDAGSNAITLNGNWINSGTFTPSTSTIVCTGTSKNITGNTIFNHVTVSGSYTILNDVIFNGLLNITSAGSLSGGGSINVTMNSDLINSGVLYNLGTTTFTGNVLQTLSLINAVQTVALTVNFNGTVSPLLNSTSTPQYGYLNINNTGGISPSVGWTILYSLTVGSGASFNGGISTHNILGAVTNNGTITSSGTLNFIPSSARTLSLGSNFSSTGLVNFGGAGAITLAGTPGSFQDMLISNTNAAGITPSSAWNITNKFTVNSGSIFNAGNYTYLVGGNILNSGTINGGTSTFTLNGTGTQNVYTLSAFNNLTISKAAGVTTLSSNATVNDVLNFVSGKIQTGSNLVIQPLSGTVSGAAQNTGWVNGNLRKNIATGATTKIFEVGDDVSYTPVLIAFSNVTTAGDLTVSSTAGDHPEISNSSMNESKSVNRFWSFTNSGIAFTYYSATFNFIATDIDAGAATGAFNGGVYSGGSWVYPSIGTLTSTSSQLTGLTAFGDFQIGERSIFVKTWDGGAGTNNWGDANNWNTDGVPASTDDVDLTGVNAINIDVAATTKSLLLNNDNLILTINPGNSLAVSGNFILTAGTFNTGSAFPTISGTVSITGGTVGFTGSNTQTIPAYNYYNLTSSSTGARILANSGIIGIAGVCTPGTNAYTITGSTIDYNGSSAQTIDTHNYNNLILSNADVKTFGSGTIGIAGSLTITGGASANATINNSTIKYNGSANQSITTMTYYNLDVLSSGGVVTLPDATISNNLTITAGTVSIGSNAMPQTIAANGNITIAAGATLNVAGTSDATHLLTLGGDIINSGTLNLRPDANSLCNTVFNKNGNQTIAGTGTTSFNNISLDMGVSNNNYVDVTTTNFSAPAGFLTLNNGSFNLNSSGVSITPFTADITSGNFLIPANAGLWVNAGTINSPSMNWTVAGLVKVTGGILNMGSITDNVVIPKNTGDFYITGGNLNLASAIINPGAEWTLLMKGGTMTVNTQGSTTAGLAPFNMDVTNCSFDVSGGTIVIQNPGGTTGQNLGYNNLATAGPGFTGGTLQIGNASTPALQTIGIASASQIYNLTVSTANAVTQSDVSVNNSLVINNSKSLAIGSNTLTLNGTISGNGTLTGSGTSNLSIGGTGSNVGILNFTTGGQTLNTLTMNRTAVVNSPAAVLGTGNNLLVSSLALQNGILAISDNLFTWDHNGGTLTAPNIPFSYNTDSSVIKNSFIALCDINGNPITATDGSKGFRVNNVGNTETWLPVGYDFGSTPNRISLQNAGTTDSYTVSLSKGDIGNTPLPKVNRVWNLTEGTATGSSVTMKLFFIKQLAANYGISQDEVETGFNYGDIHLVHKIGNSFQNNSNASDIQSAISRNNGSEIYALYTIGTSRDNDGVYAGITSFHRFSVVNANGIILPVNIINLKAYQQERVIKVDWLSLNEVNTDHYEIQRSADAIQFNTSGSIKAMNNSNSTQYRYTDVQPLSGNNFYRIKAFDRDGSVKYTQIVQVNFNNSGKMAISIYPNPVNTGSFTLMLNNLGVGRYNVQLYNMAGVQIFNTVIDHPGGSASRLIYLPQGISNGVYQLLLSNGKNSFNYNIVVAK
jgi:hypothetical protein